MINDPKQILIKEQIGSESKVFDAGSVRELLARNGASYTLLDGSSMSPIPQVQGKRIGNNLEILLPDGTSIILFEYFGNRNTQTESGYENAKFDSGTNIYFSDYVPTDSLVNGGYRNAALTSTVLPILAGGNSAWALPAAAGIVAGASLSKDNSTVIATPATVTSAKTNDTPNNDSTTNSNTDNIQSYILGSVINEQTINDNTQYSLNVTTTLDDGNIIQLALNGQLYSQRVDANGNASIVIPSSSIQNLPIGQVNYDLIALDSAGNNLQEITGSYLFRQVDTSTDSSSGVDSNDDNDSNTDTNTDNIQSYILGSVINEQTINDNTQYSLNVTTTLDDGNIVQLALNGQLYSQRVDANGNASIDIPLVAVSRLSLGDVNYTVNAINQEGQVLEFLDGSYRFHMTSELTEQVPTDTNERNVSIDSLNIPPINDVNNSLRITVTTSNTNIGDKLYLNFSGYMLGPVNIMDDITSVDVPPNILTSLAAGSSVQLGLYVKDDDSEILANFVSSIVIPSVNNEDNSDNDTNDSDTNSELSDLTDATYLALMTALINAINNIGSNNDGSSSTPVLPTILSIGTTFGSSISAAEVASAAVVTVNTNGISDGETISLSLGSFQYTAQVSGNKAPFAIPLNDMNIIAEGNYTLTATLQSDATVTKSLNVLVDVTAPSFTTQADPVVLNEDENISTTQVVFTAQTTDANGVTYSINGTDAGFFSINSITGELRFNNSPDYEIKNSYSLNVIATDSAGNTAEKAFTLSINDLDETNAYLPAIPTVSSLNTTSLTPVITGTAVVQTNEELIVSVSGATYRVNPDNNGVWSLNLTQATPISGTLTQLEAGNNYDVIATVRLISDTNVFSDDTTTDELIISNQLETDTTAPTLYLYIEDEAEARLGIGETATVTLRLTESLSSTTPLTLDALTVINATLSNLTATSDPLVFTATLTPDNTVTGTINVSLNTSNLVDNAGNILVLGNDLMPEVDTLTPVDLTISHEVTSNTQTELLTNANSMSLSGVESSGIVYYSLDAGLTWQTIPAGVRSITIPDGQYESNQIQVYQVDAFGNESNISTLEFTGSLSIDSTPPQIESTRINYSSNIVDSEMVVTGQITITFEDDALLSGDASSTSLFIPNLDGGRVLLSPALDLINKTLTFDFSGVIPSAADNLRPTSLFLDDLVVADSVGNTTSTYDLSDNITYVESERILMTSLDDISALQSTELTVIVTTSGLADGRMIKLTMSDSNNSTDDQVYLVSSTQDQTTINIPAADLQALDNGTLSYTIEIVDENGNLLTDQLGNQLTYTNNSGTLLLDDTAPVFDSSIPTTFTINENTLWAGQIFSATDNLSNNLAFRLTPESPSYFEIDKNTGALTILAASANTQLILDHESMTDYVLNDSNQRVVNLSVIVSDEAGNEVTQQVTINVADLDESDPTFTQVGVETNLDGSNDIIGTAIYDASTYARDTADGDDNTDKSDDLIYTFKIDPISGDPVLDGNYFSINPQSGEVTFAPEGPLRSEYMLVVVARDQAGNMAEQTITVNVDNLNQSVDETAPNFVSYLSSDEQLSTSISGESLSFLIEENVSTSNLTYAFTLDDPTALVSLGGTNANLFNLSTESIGSNTVATLSFINDSFDFETDPTNLNITLNASDTENNIRGLDLSFDVLDVNESTGTNLTNLDWYLEQNSQGGVLVFVASFNDENLNVVIPDNSSGPQLRLGNSTSNINILANYVVSENNDELRFEWLIPDEFTSSDLSLDVLELIVPSNVTISTSSGPIDPTVDSLSISGLSYPVNTTLTASNTFTGSVTEIDSAIEGAIYTIENTATYTLSQFSLEQEGDVLSLSADNQTGDVIVVWDESIDFETYGATYDFNIDFTVDGVSQQINQSINVIDTNAVEVVSASIESTQTSGLSIGDPVFIDVVFSEAITIDTVNPPSIKMTDSTSQIDNTANFDSISSNTIRFTWNGQPNTYGEFQLVFTEFTGGPISSTAGNVDTNISSQHILGTVEYTAPPEIVSLDLDASNNIVVTFNQAMTFSDNASLTLEVRTNNQNNDVYNLGTYSVTNSETSTSVTLAGHDLPAEATSDNESLQTFLTGSGVVIGQTITGTIENSTGVGLTNGAFFTVAAGAFFDADMGIRIFDKDGELLTETEFNPVAGIIHYQDLLPPDYSGQMLVQVFDKNAQAIDYLDEFTNQGVDLNSTTAGLGLRAIIDYDGSMSNLPITVTPLTELAVRLSGAEAGSVLPHDFLYIAKQLDDFFDMVQSNHSSVDVITSDTFDLSDGTNEAEYYGLILAALSSIDNVTGSIDATLNLLTDTHDDAADTRDSVINMTIDNIRSSENRYIIEIAEDLVNVVERFNDFDALLMSLHQPVVLDENQTVPSLDLTELFEDASDYELFYNDEALIMNTDSAHESVYTQVDDINIITQQEHIISFTDRSHYTEEGDINVYS